MSGKEEAAAKASKPELIAATLAKNFKYGTAIRRGKSGKVYTFKIGVKTDVSAEDFKEFSNPKFEHHEPYLTEYKAAQQ